MSHEAHMCVSKHVPLCVWGCWGQGGMSTLQFVTEGCINIQRSFLPLTMCFLSQYPWVVFFFYLAQWGSLHITVFYVWAQALIQPPKFSPLCWPLTTTVSTQLNFSDLTSELPQVILFFFGICFMLITQRFSFLIPQPHCLILWNTFLFCFWRSNKYNINHNQN